MTAVDTDHVFARDPRNACREPPGGFEYAQRNRKRVCSDKRTQRIESQKAKCATREPLRDDTAGDGDRGKKWNVGRNQKFQTLPRGGSRAKKSERNAKRAPRHLSCESADGAKLSDDRGQTSSRS